MNKSQLIKSVAEKSDLSQKQVSETLTLIEAALIESLKAGEKVQLSGFGTFGCKRREAREGKNPRTGELVTISAADVPYFKASKALKEAVK